MVVNKKIKVLVMIIMSILLVMLLKNYSYGKDDVNDGVHYERKDYEDFPHVSLGETCDLNVNYYSRLNNWYCIQRGESWSQTAGNAWTFEEEITIDGDVATDSSGNTYYGTMDYKFGAIDTEIVSAILYERGGIWMDISDQHSTT